MKKLLIALLVIVFAVVVLVGVLIYLTGRTEEKVSITPAAYAAIQTGMTTDQVNAVTGTTPEDGLAFTDGEPPVPAGADCDYYLRKDQEDVAFRVCFANGRVVQKAAYRVTG